MLCGEMGESIKILVLVEVFTLEPVEQVKVGFMDCFLVFCATLTQVEKGYLLFIQCEKNNASLAAM